MPCCDWHAWPPQLRRPSTAAHAAAPADRVAFHAWLQQRCAEQLAAANEAAAGMAVGIIHDLAVGIDPGGADAWTLQDVIAQGARVGAPPDAFNQQGQDWGLATWRPDRLAATGYRAYRELLRGIFRLAAEGLIEPDSTDEEIVLAMHRLLKRTPCRVVLASPYDVLGTVRQPNLLGTIDQYPNWRIPLPLFLEDLIGDARMRQVADLLNDDGVD